MAFIISASQKDLRKNLW